MKRILAFLVAIALTHCGAAIAQGGDVKQLTDDSRKVADQLLQQVNSELTRALQNGGPLRAIIVCKYSVPEITSAVSRKTGWKVSRVSLRPRNPALAMPDAWEQKVLVDFDARRERGEKIEALEHAEVVQEGGTRYFRYLKAVAAGPQCMGCHGPVEQLSDAVRAQLAADYPYDRGIGYRVGQVRGAITVRRPLN